MSSRRAPYSYGRDQGTRVVTSGVWRPVTLRFYDITAISDYCVRQLLLTDEDVCLPNELIINQIASQKIPAEIRVSVSLNGITVTEVKQQVILQSRVNHITLPAEVTNPVRWIPNGWGTPTLYDFSAQIACGDRIVAEQSHRIGLRTIRMVNEKDKDGESFHFEVNDTPMFAKGANYIPRDALLPDITMERYQTSFRDVREININVVHIQGGRTYGNSLFYDPTDENGVPVWQDLMFACTPYPSDPTSLKRVEAEAVYNTRRLWNHASLAIWCGNNEILEAPKYWGFEKKLTPEAYQGLMYGYDKLFRELLPSIAKEFDSDRLYVHSSPHFANWGRPESWGIGDSYNWGVWYGEKPFESLGTDLPRFVSEFGFQLLPEMETIAASAASEDYQIESEVVNAHQKSSTGNSLIRVYMGRNYIIPEGFENFVYIELVLQGQGMWYGLEAHRHNCPYCMGILYWQLNDSWPVVSWSSIDYYGNWKASYYQAKRVFAPVLINLIQQNDSLSVYLISDRLDIIERMTLEMKVVDFDGKMLGKEIQVHSLEVLADTSKYVYHAKLDGWLTPEDHRCSLLKLILKDKSGHQVVGSIHLFRKTKGL